MDPREEIRNRLTIEEIVGQYVQLKKSGRNLKANCPFHQEKSPSFIVSPDKGLAYCFGCRKGGDIFAFVQQIENVDFPEALKILAEKAGVEVKSTFKKDNKDRQTILLEVVEQAQRFFTEHLQAHGEAQQYLEKRGFDRKLQRQLGLGFAPDSFHELTKYLTGKDYRHQDILEAGLAAQKQVGDSHIYDRFRNRIIFPIHDPQGRLVAFGGRAMSSEDPAKYLNSSETALYHKGQTLYCFHTAKQAIREQDQAIVVEGYFDALTCQVKGFPQTVASLGTALTEEQVKLIGRFTKNLLFAFDADTSGQAAASRSIEIAQRLGLNVSIIRIPSGKDPDDALRTMPAEWEKAVHQAVPAMEYELQKALSLHDRGTITGKKAIVEYFLPMANRLPNAVEQEYYLKKLSFELDTSLSSLLQQMKKIPSTRPFSTPPKDTPIPTGQEKELQPLSRFDYLACLIVGWEDYRSLIFSLLKPEYMISEEEKALYKVLEGQYNQSDVNTPPPVFDEQDQRRLTFLELLAETRYSGFTAEKLQEEVHSLCKAIRDDYQRRSLRSLRHQLTNDPQNPQLLTDLNRLLSDQF